MKDLTQDAVPEHKLLHESLHVRHLIFTYLQSFSWAKENYLLDHCGLP